MSSKEYSVKKINLNKTKYWTRVAIKLRKYKTILWFIVPAATLAFLLGYLPLIGILIAFKSDFTLAINSVIDEIFRDNWTLEQFSKIFEDAGFTTALFNTLTINVVKIVLVFPFTIILAIMLSEVKSTFLSKLILIMLCLPNFLSWPVVIGIWENFFQEVDGVVNNILLTMNVIDSPVYWFGSEVLFKPFVIIIDMWKGCGWNSIMFYAAIMSIDKSYYEAATLDGCSKFKQIIHLTIPSIIPIIALMFIMNITYILSSGFEEVQLLLEISDPSLRTAMKTLDVYLYETALGEGADQAFGTALGIFNSTVSLIFMLAGNKLCRKFLHKGLW